MRGVGPRTGDYCLPLSPPHTAPGALHTLAGGKQPEREDPAMQEGALCFPTRDLLAHLGFLPIKDMVGKGCGVWIARPRA